MGAIQSRTDTDYRERAVSPASPVVGVLVSSGAKINNGEYTYRVEVTNPSTGNAFTIPRAMETVSATYENSAGKLKPGTTVEVQKISRTLWIIINTLPSRKEWEGGTPDAVITGSATDWQGKYGEINVGKDGVSLGSGRALATMQDNYLEIDALEGGVAIRADKATTRTYGDLGAVVTSSRKVYIHGDESTTGEPGLVALLSDDVTVLASKYYIIAEKNTMDGTWRLEATDVKTPLYTRDWKYVVLDKADIDELKEGTSGLHITNTLEMTNELGGSNRHKHTISGEIKLDLGDNRLDSFVLSDEVAPEGVVPPKPPTPPSLWKMPIKEPEMESPLSLTWEAVEKSAASTPMYTPLPTYTIEWLYGQFDFGSYPLLGGGYLHPSTTSVFSPAASLPARHDAWFLLFGKGSTLNPTKDKHPGIVVSSHPTGINATVVPAMIGGSGTTLNLTAAGNGIVFSSVTGSSGPANDDNTEYINVIAWRLVVYDYNISLYPVHKTGWSAIADFVPKEGYNG